MTAPKLFFSKKTKMAAIIRRNLVIIVGFLAMLGFSFYFFNFGSAFDSQMALVDENYISTGMSIDSVHGTVIMSQLGNATLKAELGRSTWKLIHTITARFPKTPNADEQAAFRSWIHLLSRLYPCGECAQEFQLILKKYPPQISSRDTLSTWACGVHNVVNERLKKPIFDCSTVSEKYKCGCDDEGVD